MSTLLTDYRKFLPDFPNSDYLSVLQRIQILRRLFLIIVLPCKAKFDFDHSLQQMIQ